MKTSFMKFLLPAFLFLTVTTVQAQTKRVLFLGNSYTSVNDLPNTFRQLALSAGDTVIVDSNAPGGYTLQGHSTNATSLSKIAQGNWDFVVLQEQSQMPSFPPAQVQQDTYPYAAELDSLIHVADSCAQTVFYMTWGRKNGDASNCASYPQICTFWGMQARLRQSYVEMADLNHATVAPAGEAWKKSRLTDSLINLWSADNSHPSMEGTYLTACVFYATLYQKTPVGLTYISSLNSSTAAFLQGIAEQVVFDSLDTWNVGIDYPHADFSFQQTSATAVSFMDESGNAQNATWIIDGQNYSGAFVNHDFGAHGNYSVSLISSNSCFTDTLTQTISVGTIGIESQAENEIRVYPNPSHNEVQIGLEGLFHYTIQDTKGSLLLSGNAVSGIELHALPKGIYFLSIEQNGKTYRTKLIKD
jgi:hypothetical protein